MAVLMTMDIPVSRADLEAVAAVISVQDHLPDGLIVHTATETADGVRVVDVWESEEHQARFAQDRLLPAVGQVMTERGVSLEGPPPQPVFTEVFDLVRGT